MIVTPLDLFVWLLALAGGLVALALAVVFVVIVAVGIAAALRANRVIKVSGDWTKKVRR